MRFKLSRVFRHEETEYRSLDVNLERLTGADVLFAETEAAAASAAPVINPIVNAHFKEQIAARAVGLLPEVIRKLPAADYMGLMNHVQLFFLEAGSEEEDRETPEKPVRLSVPSPSVSRS